MGSDAILSRARAVLRANDAGAFTRPSPGQYPHQWNWDSAFIALGLSYFDPRRAQQEIRSLLRSQWRDGMLPHVVYHGGPSEYFPGPDFWQTERSPNAPPLATSGLTQPPILASVLRRIHAQAPIPAFLAEAYPALHRWHRWLHQARDPDGSGLAFLVHPWESGTDDSPRWLEALERIMPAGLPTFRRRDTTHVAANERPSDADYERFVYLIDVLRRHRYEPAALAIHSPFLVQDVLFNAVLHRADRDLRALAIQLAEPIEEIDGWLARSSASFSARFWDEAKGRYCDYDLRAGARLAANTVATFMPLYAGLADERQARRLIEEHWINPAEYSPDHTIRFRVTTTSMAEPSWEARRYWRGPVWIVVNWLLIQGLRRYGYRTLAGELHQDTLTLIGRSGFREYYDPRDGSGCGSDNFSWSAALALDLLLGKEEDDEPVEGQPGLASSP